MAFLLSRTFGRNVRSHISLANRFYGQDKELPDPMELATGLEKLEKMQILSGNDDPFRMKAIQRMASTKSNPNLIPSYYDCRVIGCVCEEDSSSIVWMWLFKGEPRRCYCGHWFKLVEYKPI